MKLRQDLEALRKDLGLTQIQIVDGTSIIVTHYSKIKRGEISQKLNIVFYKWNLKEARKYVIRF